MISTCVHIISLHRQQEAQYSGPNTNMFLLYYTGRISILGVSSSRDNIRFNRIFTVSGQGFNSRGSFLNINAYQIIRVTKDQIIRFKLKSSKLNSVFNQVSKENSLGFSCYFQPTVEKHFKFKLNEVTAFFTSDHLMMLNVTMRRCPHHQTTAEAVSAHMLGRGACNINIFQLLVGCGARFKLQTCEHNMTFANMDISQQLFVSWGADFFEAFSSPICFFHSTMVKL